ncbi:hypothetical protein [Larsenimonas salina]|uniref:hypothetical protein n=1 Tax=Larsenimonas salina TaxID=1295565 RepID=UPI0020744A51|nr:hypothetical protein [Larsenimonas salina]MCM5705849.1 hypothetical protein [Larsenimonas salina]
MQYPKMSFKNQELEDVFQGKISAEIPLLHQKTLKRYMDVMAISADLSLINCIAKAHKGNIKTWPEDKIDGHELYSININGRDYCLFFRFRMEGSFFDLDYGPAQSSTD